MAKQAHAVVLMTALIPTEGHAALASFAAHLPHTQVWVLINARSFEPYAGSRRLAAVSEALSHLPQVTVRLSENELAPQNPEDHPDFWRWWEDEINQAFPEVNKAWDFVVASELYGASVANQLGARFLPYDVQRQLLPTKGAQVRDNMWDSWPAILRSTRQDFQLKAVLFGQESVGKTTVSKLVAEQLACTWLFEYARPYLETVGPEITAEKMDSIYQGQLALQQKNFHEATTAALIMDTDLFSTVGYYGIMGYTAPKEVVQAAKAFVADVYYVLDDSIPFEEDVLRYGGNQRESSKAYWLQLLKVHGQHCVLVPPGTAEEEARFVSQDIKKRFCAKTAKVREFVRE